MAVCGVNGANRFWSPRKRFRLSDLRFYVNWRVVFVVCRLKICWKKQGFRKMGNQACSFLDHVSSPPKLSPLSSAISDLRRVGLQLD